MKRGYRAGDKGTDVNKSWFRLAAYRHAPHCDISAHFLSNDADFFSDSGW